MKYLRIVKILLAFTLLSGASLQAEEAYDVEWVKQFGTSDSDGAYSIKSDVNGNIFVTGWLYGAIARNVGDSFVTKYSSDGTLQWTKILGSTNYGTSDSIIDKNGDILLAGYKCHDINGQNYVDGCKISIDKYDTNGTLLWSEQFGSSGYARGLALDSVSSITSDSSGNIYVSGSTRGIFAGGVNNGAKDGYITKYDTNGLLLWIKQFGTAYDDIGGEITIDSRDNIFVTGWTGGTFDGEINAGRNDAFIVKYDTNGTLLWNRQFGTSGYEYPYAITTNINGDIFVGGSTAGAFNGEVYSGGSSDAFIVKYSNDGTFLWNRQFGTSSHDYIWSMTTDKNGNPIASGGTGDSLNSETSSGGYDAFVIKYNLEGTQLWTKQFGTVASEHGYSIIVDNGSLFVAGNTYGTFDGEVSSGNEDAFLAKLSSPNTAPVAIATATPETVILNGTIVALDASQSYDPDADNISFTWDWIEKPLNSVAIFSNANSINPTFIPDINGTYTISLTVNDGSVDSDPVNVSIEAITVQTATTNLIEQAIQELIAMPDSSFSNKNHRKTLINKLNVVVKMLASSKYQNAISKLQNDLLPKVDGYLNSTQGNKTDWIITADDQSLIYDLLAKTIKYLKNDTNL